MNIEDYGFDGKLDIKKDKEMPARIIETHRDRYEIVSSKGTGYARLKRGSYYDNPNAILPTIGDFVGIEYNELGDSMITNTLKRKSYFSRLDPSPDGEREQFIAANFDYVFIMQSLNGNYNLRRIERYLTLAWQSGAVPVILLTKCDLVNDYTSMLYEVESGAIGVEVHVISTKTGEGLDKLQKYFSPGKTIVFLGSSGVGKSTLVNKLANTEIMRTQEIRKEDSRGRHTTTNRKLIMLPNGAMIIDTPGMRELGMWDVSEGLDKTFTDVEGYLGKCRFSNCTHTSEPGCAILEAIEEGFLTEARYNSYIKLKNEAKYVNDTNSYIEQKRQKFKEIAKQNKKNFNPKK